MYNTSIPFPVLGIWIFAILLPVSVAQTPNLFQWALKIEPDMHPGPNASNLSPNLPTCTPLKIVVKSLSPDVAPVPPYYMMAFPVNGTPIITSIGTDENNLIWNVTNPVGSQLILTVVDRNGNPGGTQLETMTVIAGKSTKCVTNLLTAPPFTLTASFADNGLATCKPWRLAIDGGIRPYTLLLSTLGAAWMTNITVPPDLDAFIYINRAPPNKHLFAVASDSTGRWAYGTPMVKTKGKKDTSCPGLVSSEVDITTIEEQDDAAKVATKAAQWRRSTIIKLSVPLALLFLFSLAGATFFYARKRKRKEEAEQAKYCPTPYTGTAPEALSTGLHRQKAMSPRSSKVRCPTPLLQSSYNAQRFYLDGPNRTASSPTTTTDIQPCRASHHILNPTLASLSANQQWFQFILLATWIYTRLPASENFSSGRYGRSATTPGRERGILRHEDEARIRDLPPGYGDLAC